ncbi:MAG: ClpXP protease specificity-enhancing factor [Rubrivivax sp.]
MLTSSDNQGTSTRPYLLRALHDWCTDNGFTPYIAVYVDQSVQVPTEYVKNNEIVLNVGFEATSGLKLGNDFIEFKARFGGSARDIVVPVDHVVAIYARENGQGMAFPVPSEASAAAAPAPTAEGDGRAAGRSGLRLASAEAEAPAEDTAASREPDPTPEPTPPTGGRPALKRVK